MVFGKPCAYQNIIYQRHHGQPNKLRNAPDGYKYGTGFDNSDCEITFSMQHLRPFLMHFET